MEETVNLWKKIKVKKIVKVQKDKLYKLPFYVMSKFKNGVAIIMQNKKYGALREDGVIIVETKYEGFTRDFEDGIAIFQNEPDNLYKYEAINKKGEIIKRTNLKIGLFLGNSFTKIYDEYKQGLIDIDGNYIMEPQDKYLLLGLYKDLAVMEKYNNPNKKYIIDKNGNKYKFFGCDIVEIIGENLIHVKKDKVHFLTDIHNNRISRNYINVIDNGSSYANTRVIIALSNEKTYFIDSLGNEKIIPDNFLIASIGEKEEMIRKIVNSYSESKDLTDDSLNIYMPTSYNDIISKCRLDGYRVPDLSISDDTAVVDYRYICKTDDLELKYVLTIYKSDDEVMKKEFNNKDECDAYYDKLIKK